MGKENIGRCLKCNNKSHLRHWKKENVDFLVCPCCDSPTGYHSGNHDGLPGKEINAFRQRHNVDGDDFDSDSS